MLVSFKEATKPVSPVKMDETQKIGFTKAMALFNSKRYSKAARSFLDLSKLFSSESTESKATASAMVSNYYKMRARRIGEDSKQTRELIEEAVKHLDSALQNEPYWAEYLESIGKMRIFVHQKFGCEASFNGKAWTTDCYKVSRALGLFGISPGWTLSLECSICGKDPVVCEHIPGEIYDGKIALMVAKDLKIDHISIVDEPMQRETYINPGPLTPDMLKRILPSSVAEAVIARKRPLTCKDLLRAIHKNHLHGLNWQS